MPGDTVSILLTVVAGLHGHPLHKRVSSICSGHAAGCSRHQAVRRSRAVHAVVTLVSPRQDSTRQSHATVGFSTRPLGTARVPFRTAVDITFPACAETRFYPRSGPVRFRVGFQSASMKVVCRIGVTAPVPTCMVAMSRLRYSALDTGHGNAWMKKRCAMKNTRITGRIKSVEPAMAKPQPQPTVYLVGSRDWYSRAR